ncbi:MAG: PadR family transcriptional regulator [Acidobacteriota bacterium]|jgi:DNA-binding PadR family transcriptional regulator
MGKSDENGSLGSFLPLKSRAFHILLALSEGDRHGYGIKQQIEELTDGVLRMGPGTLYETIHRLEKKGLIEDSPHRPDPAEDHSQRRYYRLTDIGRRVLSAEVERLGNVIDYARARVSPD